MSFDKSRPYGEINPPLKQARYEQDGKFYTTHGVLCDSDGVAVPPAEPVVAVKEPPAAPPPQEPEPQPDLASVNGAEDQPIDLIGWAKRSVNYQWFKVKSAAKEKYGNDFTTAEDARAFIMNLPLAQ